MKSRSQIGFLVLMATVWLGCSPVVPKNWVPGTYKASYPFGTEVLTLERDGEFTQRIELRGHAPVLVRGKWKLEDDDAPYLHVTIRGALNITDGFGNLRKNWVHSKDQSGGAHSVSLDWFRVTLDDAAPYPYVKQ